MNPRYLFNSICAIYLFQACGSVPTPAEAVTGQSTTGQKGDQGPAGKDGTNGANGVDGKDGVNGTNGATPTVAAVIPATAWQNPTDDRIWIYLGPNSAQYQTFAGCTGAYRQPTTSELTHAAQSGIRAAFQSKGYTVAAEAWATYNSAGVTGVATQQTKVDLTTGATDTAADNNQKAIFCVKG